MDLQLHLGTGHAEEAGAPNQEMLVNRGAIGKINGSFVVVLSIPGLGWFGKLTTGAPGAR